jgi:hypothetical protein
MKRPVFFLLLAAACTGWAAETPATKKKLLLDFQLLPGFAPGAGLLSAQTPAPAGPVYLRLSVDPKSLCQFAWSPDNSTFTPIDEPIQSSVDRWIGAKFDPIAAAAPGAITTGPAGFDWFPAIKPNN